jgi:hypothetical protein
MSTNQFAQRANQKRRRRALERIRGTAKRQSVYDRLGPFNQALSIVLILLIVWSVLTEFAFIFPQLLNTAGSKAFAITVTVILIISIEVLKIVGGRTLIRMVSFGWLQDGGHYRVMFGILLLPVLAAFLSSAYCTIMGAPTTVDHINRQTTTLPLVDLQEIRAGYDAKIAHQEQVIQQGKQMTWKGKVVSDGRKLIRQANETIEKLNDDLEAELAAARAKNSELVAGNQADVANVGTWLQGFGGIGELFSFLLLVFMTNYERAVADEDDGNDPEDSPPSPPGRKKSPPTAREIPFSLNGLTLSGLSEQSGTRPGSPEPPRAKMRAVRDDRVIEHKGADGNVKLYTRKQVEGFISKYNGRLRRQEEKIEEGTADQKIKDAYSNNLRWVNYWNDRLQEFDQPLTKQA